MGSLKSEGHLFVENLEKCQEVYEKEYCLPNPASVTEIENGIILPLKRRTDVTSWDVAFKGGICDKDGNFVAGHCKSLKEGAAISLSCLVGYELPPAVVKRHETVVFGGILFRHFGHLISEGIAPRLWWYSQHPDTPYKVVFLESFAHSSEFKFYNILEMIGLTRDRMEIISEPTQFDKIIIPQEALYMWSNYRPNMNEIYEFYQKFSVPSPHKKIYLSRTKFSAQDSLNELYFENFFSKRGYFIVYPETMSFPEQVGLMYGADEVVCTNGTLGMLPLFCKSHTKVVMLNRSHTINIPNFILLQGRNMDYYVIDANYNFLPTMQAGAGVYFYGPTEQWKSYLEKTQIAYSMDEVSADIHVKPYIYEYILKWGKTFSASPRSYKAIRNFTLIDVLDEINMLFLQNKIDRKVLAERDDVVRLKKKNKDLTAKVSVMEARLSNYENILKAALIEQEKKTPMKNISSDRNSKMESMPTVYRADKEELKEQVALLKQEIKNLKRSLSWRITKPLRVLKAWLRKIFHK